MRLGDWTMSLLQTDGSIAVGRQYHVSAYSEALTDAPACDSFSGAAARDEEDASSELVERLHLSRMFLAGLSGARAASDERSHSAPSGSVGDDAKSQAIARDLGLPFANSVDPDRLMVRENDLPAALARSGGVDVAMMENGDRPATILVTPNRAALPRLHRFLAGQPALKQRLRVVSRRTLREAFVSRAGPHLLRGARNGLFDRYPKLSARIVVNAWQGAMVGAGMVMLPAALIWAPATTTLLLHAFFSLLFFSCVFLRLAAALRAKKLRYAPLRPVLQAELPVYTILVALYREADIVPDLLVALGRIVWPRDKLEIKLVCEADDDATLRALETQNLRPSIEIVRVPPSAPRTKPKALAYALQLASGEFVALYDAEDRPHPLQLVEAWQRFSLSDCSLACVQAPLVISNWNRGILARMFAFEYAAVFRGLLPWLSSCGLMFPLGGTSNHFRRSALNHVGAWDPYNVTEDADLGLKLHRFGYSTATITRPTFEDAPDDLSIWVRQRTRWFKGWLQTWLVHMRDPVRFAREMGPGSFLIAQILFAGMVASALVHPLIAFTLIGLVAKIAWMGAATRLETALLAVDAINLGCGYLAFLILGGRTLVACERAGLRKIALCTPAYWMLMSTAASRSVWHLYRQPHLWEKTPHRPHRAVMAEGRRDISPTPRRQPQESQALRQ